jgi:threonine synthase
MGLPIDKLIVATNENDILQRVINKGEYKPDKVKASLSPSMDIQVSSNFERLLFYIVGNDDGKVKSMMKSLQDNGFFQINEKEIKEIKKDFLAIKINDKETVNIIKEVNQKNKFVIDPHTATAFGAINKTEDLSNVIALGTAHPYKFFETVKEAIGKDLQPPKQFEKFVDKEEKFDILDNNISEVKKYILNKI